jgi:hypothetical protein
MLVVTSRQRTRLLRAMLTDPHSAYRRKRDASSASCWCSRFGATRSALLLRKRVLLALLHPLLQGCSRDPYRSAKTDHRQSLFGDEFIDLAAAQSQRCRHVWDAQQQRLCWRSLEIIHGFCFFHRWIYLVLSKYRYTQQMCFRLARSPIPALARIVLAAWHAAYSRSR